MKVYRGNLAQLWTPQVRQKRRGSCRQVWLAVGWMSGVVRERNWLVSRWRTRMWWLFIVLQSQVRQQKTIIGKNWETVKDNFKCKVSMMTDWPADGYWVVNEDFFWIKPQLHVFMYYFNVCIQYCNHNNVNCKYFNHFIVPIITC